MRGSEWWEEVFFLGCLALLAGMPLCSICVLYLRVEYVWMPLCATATCGMPD